MSYTEVRASSSDGREVLAGPRAAKSSQLAPAVHRTTAVATNGSSLRGKSARAAARKDVHAIARRLWPALRLLQQAYEYAEDTGRDPEDFAVELLELRRVGMTNTDCRWLVCKGWAYLLQEIKARPKEARRFRHDVGLAVQRGSCLVLTPDGMRLARQANDGLQNEWSDDTVRSLAVSHAKPMAPGQPGRVVPHWDRDRHELRVGSQVVKQFKLLSPNQEMILAVFDEENWPPRIDDPLPPSKRVNSKQRLHDTIKNLNRNQKHRLLRFLGDGTGQGVRWELIAQEPIMAPVTGPVTEPKT